MSSYNSPVNGRARRSKTGSVSSLFTAESSDSAGNIGVDPTVDNLNDEVAVGLSDPSNTGTRRAILQLINRLRDTRYGDLFVVPFDVDDRPPAEYKLTLTYP